MVSLTLPTLLLASAAVATGLAIIASWALGRWRATARFEAALAERDRQLADNAAVAHGLRGQIASLTEQLKRERSKAGTAEVGRRASEAEVVRLSVRVEALERDLEGAAEDARQARESHRVALGAANGLVDQGRRDQARLGERLLEVTRALEVASRERTHLEELLEDAGARTRAAAAERIERELELSQAVSDRDARIGILQAKAERVDPLVRRLEDREALLRAVLFERDAAMARLAEAGRRVETEAGAAAAESKRRRLLETRTEDLEERLGQAERRAATASRERDLLGAEAARLELELATAREESRSRDRRFRALAETNDQRLREMTQRIMELEAEMLAASAALTEAAEPPNDSEGRLYWGPSSVDE